MSIAATRTQLATHLSGHTAALPAVTIGFDGFVDEMIRLVAERQNLESYTAVPTIAAFGELVGRAAGHSSLREIEVTAVHPGGCAINMGDGLAAFGIPVNIYATLGEPPHPAFASVTRCFRQVHSWGREPGRTLAYEFADGKFMFSSVTQLAELTVGKVTQLLADGAYARSCHESKLIALTDWTLYPHMTSVWLLLQEKVYRKLNHRPAFFIDLVDPSSRAPADIHAMLEILPGFEATGPVTLGLNGNEANILARILGLPLCDESELASTGVLAENLRDKLKVSSVVIHHIKSAALASPEGGVTLAGPYCPKPKKSTGAGDRFNAGYALALLVDLPPLERLLCACGASGYFVREARSASLCELASFLHTPDWPE